MRSNFFCVQELDILVDALDQPLCLTEFRRQVRPSPLDKVSPELYRSVFRICEAVRILREVAEEGGVEEPLNSLLQIKPEKEPEEC